MIVRDIASAFERVKLKVVNVRRVPSISAEFALPELEAGERPVNSDVDFESQTFPPRRWEAILSPGNVCRPDAAAGLSGARGLLCRDLQSPPSSLIRAGLRFALPTGRLPGGRFPMS